MGQISFQYHQSYANHVLLVTKSFYWISSNYWHEPMGQISFQYHQSYANHVLLVLKSFYWISTNY